VRPSLQLSTDGQTEGMAVAVVTRSPGGRRRGVLMTPAKYKVDRSTGGEVMGIFLQTAQLAAVTLTFDPLTLKLINT